jgi:DNA repair protein RadA/Sms
MAAAKTNFFCQSCGYQSPKWMGKCPSCGSWNSFAEEVVQKKKAGASWVHSEKVRAPKPVKITEVEQKDQIRLNTGDEELNRILGGGLVPGSIILLGGEPGIGKSTLMLQLATKSMRMKVLYVSGEESEQQIRMRAGRIGIQNEECYVLAETQMQRIFQHINDIQPDLLVVDSIQTLQTESIESSQGSVSQIR